MISTLADLLNENDLPSLIKRNSEEALNLEFLPAQKIQNSDDEDLSHLFYASNDEQEEPEIPEKPLQFKVPAEDLEILQAFNVHADPVPSEKISDDENLKFFSMFNYGEDANEVEENDWDIFPFKNLSEALDDDCGVESEKIVRLQKTNIRISKVVIKLQLKPCPPIEIFDVEIFFQEQLQFHPFYSLEAFDPFHISCKICCYKLTDYHLLPCSHGFCVSCIGNFLESKVETLKILPEDLTCPECPILLPEPIVQKFTSCENYEKILSNRYKIKCQTLTAQGKAVACPVPDCIGYAHLIPGEKITACNKCTCSLCALCKNAVHPGVTCEENKINDLDSELEKLILSQNWKKCPTCGIPVEKIDGCQFLYCDSQVCRGRNNLCFLCGRFVIEAQHFSHYLTKGPYGDSCNTLEGLPEVDIDPSLLVPVFADQQENADF